MSNWRVDILREFTTQDANEHGLSSKDIEGFVKFGWMRGYSLCERIPHVAECSADELVFNP